VTALARRDCDLSRGNKAWRTALPPLCADTSAAGSTSGAARAPWRLLPGDFPPWHAVYDQARRWMAAGVFEAMAHDLRAVLRLDGRAGCVTHGSDPRQPHDALHARERRQG